MEHFMTNLESESHEEGKLALLATATEKAEGTNRCSLSNSTFIEQECAHMRLQMEDMINYQKKSKNEKG